MKHHTTLQKTSSIKALALVAALMLVFSVTAVSGQLMAYGDKDTTKEKDVKKKTAQTKEKTKKVKSEKTSAKTKQQSIGINVTSTQSAQNTLDVQLSTCKQKQTQREQYDCEKEIKAKKEIADFKAKSTKHVIGPVTFYAASAKVEKSGGKDIVNLRFLVENTGSKDNVTLYCTGPAVCNYDLSDGKTTFKYASQDFTNGQIVLKPGKSRIFNMLFGPAIGYGSYVDFKFDPARQYTFNVREPWGSGSIPLSLN